MKKYTPIIAPIVLLIVLVVIAVIRLQVGDQRTAGTDAEETRFYMPWLSAHRAHTGVVKAERLNLRDKPDPQGRILGVFRKGTHLQILEERDGWLHVRGPNQQEGWVAAKYVQQEEGD